MSSTNRILVEEIVKDKLGKPVKIIRRDDHDEVIWKWRENNQGEVERQNTNTCGLLDDISYYLPKSIQKPKLDGLRAPRVWAATDRARKQTVEDGQVSQIILNKDVYDWLHEILNRDMPQTKEQKEDKEAKRTYAEDLWGLNAPYILWVLTDPDLRKPFEEIDT